MNSGQLIVAASLRTRYFHADCSKETTRSRHRRCQSWSTSLLHLRCDRIQTTKNPTPAPSPAPSREISHAPVHATAPCRGPAGGARLRRSCCHANSPLHTPPRHQSPRRSRNQVRSSHWRRDYYLHGMAWREVELADVGCTEAAGRRIRCPRRRHRRLLLPSRVDCCRGVGLDRRGSLG